MKKFPTYLLPVLLLSVALTSLMNVYADAAASPEYYLSLARHANGTEKYAAQIAAATAYIRLKDYVKAHAVLDQIPVKQLTLAALANYQLAAAKLAFATQQIVKAQQILLSMASVSNLTIDAQTERDVMLALSYQALQQPLSAIKTRLDLSLLLNDPAAENQNQQLIWRLSQQLSPATLAQLANDPTQPVLQGWAALTLIARQDKQQNPHKLITDLRAWRSAYPDHPAAALLTAVLPNADLLLADPKHIAVFLPLQGPLQAQGNAIWQGFLYAYYQMAAAQRPQLTLYDTTQANMKTLYDHAIKDGADFIVGPLTTDNVAELANNTHVTVPTLALNFSDGALSDNFYEFGLSASNDVAQVAQRIWQDGYSRVITFTGDNSSNTKVLDDFNQVYAHLGGTVLGSVSIQDPTAVSDNVAAILDIPASRQRATTIRNLAGAKIVYLPRRRQDVEAIFINLSSLQARQLMPLLRYYYAQDIPVYATSLVYDGNPATQQDVDLNGIMFTDMPWVNNPPAKLQAAQQTLQTLWPNDYFNYNKLYAVGIDAYNLIFQLNQMRVFPQNVYAGATGEIYLKPDHHLYRELNWAKFSNGKLIALKNS